MTQAEHSYTPPRHAGSKDVPPQVARYLDGADLQNKTQALRLSTVDAAGWPHAALLSAGDMVALPGGRIRFAVFKDSGTAANLARDGRVTVTLALDGGMCEIRMRARRLIHSPADLPLTFFEAEVQTTRTHIAPYAALVSGFTFALHDPQSALPRWRRQIEALRAAS